MPGAGLQTQATRAQSSEGYSSMLGVECVKVATGVVYMGVDSLVMYPDPALLEYIHQISSLDRVPDFILLKGVLRSRSYRDCRNMLVQR